MYINGIYFDDEQARTLSRAAVAAGKERGYCNETLKIIADLGLPVPTTRKRVTLVLDVETTDDQNLTDSYYWNLSHDLVTVVRGEWTVESVTDSPS